MTSVISTTRIAKQAVYLPIQFFETNQWDHKTLQAIFLEKDWTSIPPASWLALTRNQAWELTIKPWLDEHQFPWLTQVRRTPKTIHDYLYEAALSLPVSLAGSSRHNQDMLIRGGSIGSDVSFLSESILWIIGPSPHHLDDSVLPTTIGSECFFHGLYVIGHPQVTIGFDFTGGLQVTKGTSFPKISGQHRLLWSSTELDEQTITFMVKHHHLPVNYD